MVMERDFAAFHLVKDDRRILASILQNIPQGHFDRASENTDTHRLIVIGTPLSCRAL